jgi:hypothetical protein
VKFFAVGVFTGLVQTHEVGAWAESAIRSERSPPEWLANLALAPKRNSFDVFARLDAIASRAGVRDLREGDLRSLLGRLARAMDVGDLDPEQLIGSLDVLQASATTGTDLRRDLGYETTKFDTRFRQDGGREAAYVQLRAWLERVRLSGQRTR